MKSVLVLLLLFFGCAIAANRVVTRIRQRSVIAKTKVDILCDQQCAPVITVEDAQQDEVAILTVFYWQQTTRYGRLLRSTTSVVDVFPDIASMGDEIPASRENIKKVQVRLVRVLKREEFDMTQDGHELLGK
jgi:hypothetical protein